MLAWLVCLLAWLDGCLLVGQLAGWLLDWLVGDSLQVLIEKVTRYGNKEVVAVWCEDLSLRDSYILKMLPVGLEPTSPLSLHCKPTP